MFREVFFNKWILGGYALVILFGIGCYFWYQHQLAPYKRSSAETAEAARKWEAAQKADTNNTPQDETNISVDGTATEDNPKKTSLDRNTESVLVSPYGFGPYPEIPPDFPADRMPPWTWSEEKRQKLIEFSNIPDILRDGELIYRIYIKMWNEGTRVLPAAEMDPNIDRVYLKYPNTVYVTYGYTENPDGTRERIISSTEAFGVKVGVDITKEEILNGNIPNHITVLSADENVGIDPYSYLGLKR